jgi:hypothetical protein
MRASIVENEVQRMMKMNEVQRMIGSVDLMLLKLIMLPSVARELALSIIMLTGSLRGEEHTEEGSDSPPSKSSSMIAG